MELQGIKIQKLFGQFDYTISLNQEEGITILTGPNGYGKTTILNIIYHFFKQNFFFFQRLNFNCITLYFSDNRNVHITKNKEKKEDVRIIHETEDEERKVILRRHLYTSVIFKLKKEEKTIEKFTFDSEIEKKLFQNISKMNPDIEQVSQYQLLDSNTRDKMDIEDYILQSSQKILEIINGFPKQDNHIEQLMAIFSCVDVYLIKEQRLLKPINVSRRYYPPNSSSRRSFSYTIQSYATELEKLIHQKQAEAFQESQRLDNSFPSRLMQNEKRLSPEEFNSRFNALTQKQQQLQQFGITISNMQVPEFNESKADVLSVYLDDSELKTNFFDDLVTKINIFVTIINEKEFAHKKININGDLGFYFITDEGNILDLTALSSGEQEEVVVLYELLFRTQTNALILIDEPEISLHVSWQKAFVRDLISISDVKHISFLLATHSPQVINDRWDLTTDLYELANGQKYMENE